MVEHISEGLATVVEIPGRPYPWGVYPRKRRQSKRHIPTAKELARDRMHNYQTEIQVRARQAWGNREPLTGPVRLAFAFYLPPRKGKEKEPDLTNLQKAAEDAIQGIMIERDLQTVRVESAKRDYDGEGLTIMWLWRE